MYELWLQLTNQNRRTESSAVTPTPEDKQVNISADYTETMVSGPHLGSAGSERHVDIIFDRER